MQWTRALAGAALIAVGAANAPALADPAADPKIPFEKYKLPNGLEIILAPDPSVPLVAVNVWYHVGSGDEVFGRSGFAHLFEHMMFQGSKNVGADKHFEILKKIGSEQINGTTNTDRTNYFEVVPSNQIETALWLESDRMSHLLDILDADQLKNQILVVRNERRQSYENRPYTKALFALHEALYPEGHPYRYLTIGKAADLDAATVADVKNFFRTWYVPANATIAISGDFEPAAAKKLVDKWFGTFPTSQKPAVITVTAPPVAARELTITDDKLAKLPEITFAWSSPANFGEGDAELDFVANALGATGPGRLYKALVYDKQLAQSVSVEQSGSQFSGTFEITVTLKSDAAGKLDEVKKIVADEVARVTREPLGDREIERVVAGVEARAIRGLESTFGRSQVLQQYNHLLGDPDKVTFDLDRYRKTTPEKIRSVAARVLDPAHEITVLTLVPAADKKKEGTP